MAIFMRQVIIQDCIAKRNGQGLDTKNEAYRDWMVCKNYRHLICGPRTG